MRSLPAALLAAQKSASGLPYVQVQVSDRVGNIRRFRWQRYYEGSEPDSHHAATVPGDASLIRARSASGTLHYQRVATPGSGSDYSAWTLLSSVSSSAGLAVASDGAAVLLFYVDTDDQTIKLRESGDYGATLGAPATVVTAAGAVGWLAADLKGDGTALLVYSVGATVYRVKRSGGTWGSAAAWTNSAASINGLACHFASDFNCVVAGSAADGPRKVWTAIYGDGVNQALDTWSALREVTTASDGSDVEFRAPFLGRADVYRVFFVEKYTGSQSYSRPFWSHTTAQADFALNVWREPVPFDLSTEYGVALANSAADVWLSTASGVWHAPLSAPLVDLSDDVLALDMEEAPGGGGGRLTLRNDDGRYNGLPHASGDSAAIRLGSQLYVSPGYRTASGLLVSSGPRFWIEGWEYEVSGGRSTLVVRAGDAWSLLEGWRARRQFVWAAGQESVLGIIAFIIGRAGLEFAALSSSDTGSTLEPAFTIQPGESGAAAVRRLLAMVPDVLRATGEYLYVINPLAADATDYAYGIDHAVLGGRYGTPSPEANRVQVFGGGVTADEFDWPSVSDLFDRLRQVHDANLTTVAEVGERAAAVQRGLEMASLDDELIVPANCGQELYDVVEVTDATAGLSAAKRRVLGSRLVLRRDRPTPAYRLRLRLGAP